MAYCTKAQVKAYLDISGTGDDDLIDALIARAQKVIDSYTGQTFEASTNTTREFSVLDDVEGRILWLDKALCSINSITNGDGTTVSSGDYSTRPRNNTPYYQIVLDANSGVVWQYSDDPDENTISVSGKWAYSASAPEDIVHATVKLTGVLYRQRAPDVEADRPILASGVWIMPANLPADVLRILEVYKRR